MQPIVGAIIILAGAVLFAAGLIADSMEKGSGGHGVTGYVLGGLTGFLGLVLLLLAPAKRAWDAIPIDEKKPGQPKQN